jgi:hypothetical protein
MPDDDKGWVGAVHENLKQGLSDDTVVLFIPSHDKKGNEISDQEMWAHEAAELFAKLFGGATAFTQLFGTWFESSTKKVHKDRPIMIQSLTKRVNTGDEAKLIKFFAFCRRMGKSTNQACIGFSINDVFYEMYDF